MWLFNTSVEKKKHLFYVAVHSALFSSAQPHSFHLPYSPLFYHGFSLFLLSMSGSWFPYLCLIEAQTECGPISLCSSECRGGLQIKKPSPGCAHQAVQHCSPGRFTTYILFYGPFFIHHNTASILLTSPAKHTSFPVPSVFFFPLYSYPYSTSLYQVSLDARKST